MARNRNPRRIVLGRLRDLNRQFRHLTARWDQKQTVYSSELTHVQTLKINNEQVTLRGGWRPRRDDEKAELSLAYWAELFHEAEAAITKLHGLRELAAQEYRRLEKIQGGPK